MGLITCTHGIPLKNYHKLFLESLFHYITYGNVTYFSSKCFSLCIKVDYVSLNPPSLVAQRDSTHDLATYPNQGNKMND